MDLGLGSSGCCSSCLLSWENTGLPKLVDWPVAERVDFSAHTRWLAVPDLVPMPGTLQWPRC